MKTQKCHGDRQRLHSYEIMRHRQKLENLKVIRKWQKIGWAFVGVLLALPIAQFLFTSLFY